MLGPDDMRKASDLLFGHWESGRRLRAMPRRLKPSARAEGYAIQAHLEERSRSPLVGWKIAATSSAGQRHINVDAPLAGRILAERVLRPGASVSLRQNHMRVVEPEFAFGMAMDLPPRSTKYEVAEVLEAVGALRLALEIPDSRFEDFANAGAPQLIADNACAQLLVLGEEETVKWRCVDLATHAVVARVAGRMSRNGTGANVLGDPRLALTWLANELSQQGLTLQAGQLVSTGTCMVPIEVEPGDEVVADFGSLGEIAVRFSE